MIIIDKHLKKLKQHDKPTYSHSKRVAVCCQFIGYNIGLDEIEIKNLVTAGNLHDLGKIKIPVSILQKPGKLNEFEWELLRQHPEMALGLINSNKFNENIKLAIKSHHERWDGTGYPNGIANEDIPVFARIISIADALDAMLAYRPYHTSRDLKSALYEIQNCAGGQFDPYIVRKIKNVHSIQYIFREII